MTILIRIVASLLCLLLSNSALSADEFEKADGYNDIYFGLGGAFANIDLDATYYDASENTTLIGSANISDNTLVGGFIGYRHNPWISVEARGFFGASDGDLLGIPVEISKFFGVFFKPSMPIHEHFGIYALAGYGATTVEALGQSETENDVAYGLGMEIGKGTNIRLQVEWLLFHDESYSFVDTSNDRYTLEVEASSVNVNLAWYFN